MEAANSGMPKRITPEILELCRSVGGSTPVVVVTTGVGKPYQCFTNAIHDIEANGGTLTLGWMISEVRDVLLLAEFHAVVERDGRLMDTSPLSLRTFKHLFSPMPDATFPKSQADVPLSVFRNLCGHRLIDRAIELDLMAMDLQRQGKEGTIEHDRLVSESRRSLNSYLSRKSKGKKRRVG